MSEYLKVLHSHIDGDGVPNGRLFRAVKWAIAELEKRDQVRRVDNGDGTVTIHWLPVTVPSTLIPEGEVPIEVRSICLPITSRFIVEGGRVEDPVNYRTDEDPAELCIILGRKPQPVTWTPPVNLPDGEYETRKNWLYNSIGDCICHLSRADRTWSDWTPLPRSGRYRKSGNVATWIGE